MLKGSENIILDQAVYRYQHISTDTCVLFLRTSSKENIENLSYKRPACVVTERWYTEFDHRPELTVILVDDIEQAFWTFVDFYRDQFDLPVVAITGTSGKTTTKDMLKHILEKDRCVEGTVSSANSRSSHLYYLLNLNDSTDVAVYETAVGRAGDVTLACEYFKPTIGLITNIDAHHLNNFDHKEDYVLAKGEIIEGIAPGGQLFINHDDSNIKKLDLTQFDGQIHTFGVHSACDYQAKQISYAEGGMNFILTHKNRRWRAFIPGYGEHQVYNALGALAVAHHLGVELGEAISRLNDFRNNRKKLQVTLGFNNSLIIDDTWHITRNSLEAALKVLSHLGKRKKKIAVLGDITDLGAFDQEIHEEAAEMVAASGVDMFITIGKRAVVMARHAQKKNPKLDVYALETPRAAFNLLQLVLNKKCVLLIKGDMYTRSIQNLARRMRRRR
nr:UDP-N-acetylmuramoyl-tripeptide--D-alanyl-D-alanine ligase [Bacillus ectoiniformans]